MLTIMPQRTGCCHVDGLAIGRIDHDLRDVFRTVQSEARPIIAAVGRPVQTITHRHGIAHITFSRPDIDRLGIALIDGQRANTLAVFVEYRLERCTTCLGLPDTAAGRAHI